MYNTALLLLAILAMPTQAKNAPDPVVRFAFYAPAQKDAPVHIVGFENDRSEAILLLSNTSDKLVSAVFVGRVDVASPGCSLQPTTEEDRLPSRSGGTVGYELLIPPHGKAVAAKVGIRAVSVPDSSSPGYLHFPRSVFEIARDRGAAYLQVQFGITSVFFKDGTAWPAELNYFLRDFDVLHPPVTQIEKSSRLQHPEPFDPVLAETEPEKCSDVTSVANALRSVRDTDFEAGVPEPHDSDSLLPQLRFTCSLEGPKAVCHMPLEENRQASGAHLLSR